MQRRAHLGGNIMSSSIQSLERALDILTLMCKNGGKMGISEIARHMQLHKSTVYRTINTLQEKEYLRKDPTTSLYALGNGAFMLGLMAASNVPLLRMARPHMAYLTEKYQEDIILTIFDDNNKVFEVACYLGNYSTTFYSPIHQQNKINSYQPSVLECMLAFRSTLKPDDSMLLAFLNNQRNWRFKKQKLNNMDLLLSYLKKIKEQRYAYECDEYHPGEVCYTVPITNSAIDLYASLSLRGMKSRLSQYPEAVLIREMRRFAWQLSVQWSEGSNQASFGYEDHPYHTFQ